MSEPHGGGARGALRLARLLAEAVLIALLVTVFGVTTVAIEGSSMAPTLADGDRVLVPKYETWLHRLGIGDYGRGDVVYFPDPSSRAAFPPLLIKRIVALEGETVEIRGGTVYVDGRRLYEPYLGGRRPTFYDMDPVRVPPGHVFVLGDNRAPLGSVDSRRFGPIPLAAVGGRAARILWPANGRFDAWWGALHGDQARVGEAAPP